MPSWPKGRGTSCHRWHLNVVHQSQSHDRLAFKRRSWTPRGEHQHFPWPQGREHPLNDVAFGMPFASDFALAVYLITARRDDLGIQRQVAARQPDPVKLQLHISLAEKVAGIFCRLQVPHQIAAPWKRLLAKTGDSAQMTQNGIADGHRC